MACLKSLREMIAMLDREGRLKRHANQDRMPWDLTADLAHAHWWDGPGMPVCGNLYCDYDALSACVGLQPKSTRRDTIRQLRDHLARRWNPQTPVETEFQLPPREFAAVPFVRNSPADAGPYINAGCVVLDDPEFGENVGVYRIQVLSPAALAVNFTPSSHAGQYLERARRRGETKVPMAIAIGVDPVTFLCAASRVAALGESEYGLSGAIQDAPLTLSRGPRTNLRVPADCEIVVEAEIDLSETAVEGPYGEYLGYVNAPKPAPVARVLACYAKPDAFLFNAFSGIETGYYTYLQYPSDFLEARQTIPDLADLYTPLEAWTCLFASIHKTRAGQGIDACRKLAEMHRLRKIVVVVDEDVDLTDTAAMWHTLATRWQPHPASEILRDVFANPNDPSNPVRARGSKILIDATRQFPEEGGPQSYAQSVRESLTKESHT